MFRFDCKRGYYFYPEAGHSEELLLRLNQGMTYENNVHPRQDISIVKCGLQIPGGVRDYAEFVRKIKESEHTFKEKILRCEEYA